MKRYTALLFFSLVFVSCNSQTRNSDSGAPLGGPCEGCEAIYEYGNKNLTSIDTLPDFLNNEPKLKITGTVFQKDGKTPASGVILYIYHTNREGIYETRGDEKGWARRHGYIRGYVKTGTDGEYTFYTFRPASYPNGREPEHIHITVKEPGKKEYYLDDFIFEDDLYFSEKEIEAGENRGGSGIVLPRQNNGYYLVERNIILGLNIPNYK